VTVERGWRGVLISAEVQHESVWVIRARREHHPQRRGAEAPRWDLGDIEAGQHIVSPSGCRSARV